MQEISHKEKRHVVTFKETDLTLSLQLVLSLNLINLQKYKPGKIEKLTVPAR